MTCVRCSATTPPSTSLSRSLQFWKMTRTLPADITYRYSSFTIVLAQRPLRDGSLKAQPRPVTALITATFPSARAASEPYTLHLVVK